MWKAPKAARDLTGLNLSRGGKVGSCESADVIVWGHFRHHEKVSVKTGI